MAKADATLARKESQLLGALDSPFCADLLGVYEDDRHVWLASTLHVGGELFHRIVDNSDRGATFSEPEAAAIFSQLLRAVEHCHSRGIMHRDIKPENLLFRLVGGPVGGPVPTLPGAMLTLDGRNESALTPTARQALQIVLVDFGSATTFEKGSTFAEVEGSPGYIAPEVIAGCYSETADLWSAGALLYTMLCGEKPGDALAQAVQREAEQSPEQCWRRGQQVAYESSTHQQWIGATVLATHTDGTVTLNVRERADPRRIRPVLAAGGSACPTVHPVWSSISDECKSLVRGLLEHDPSRRLTVSSALRHPWLVAEGSRPRASALDVAPPRGENQTAMAAPANSRESRQLQAQKA